MPADRPYSVQVRSDRIAGGTVTVSLAAGSLGLICGRNGSGKSTILRGIAGQVQPGVTVVWADDSVPQSIVYIPQHACDKLHPLFRLGDFVGDVARSRGADQRRFFQELLSILDVLHVCQPDRLLLSYPSQTSGGERQRLIVAAALALEFDLLLLDEPFSNLQPDLRNTCFELVSRRIRPAATCLSVTHDQDILRDAFVRVSVELDP